MNYETLQTVLLQVAQQETQKAVLTAIVSGLADLEGTALARIWLEGPGDICSDCRMRPECPDQRRCLHLEASAGGPIAGDQQWSDLKGSFCRMPLGVRKIGYIGKNSESILIQKFHKDEKWLANPEWAHREHIISFAGQPLIFKGETLGVLAVFSRSEMGEPEHRWLRIVADQAAAAIANARAFEEIERLKAKLLHENRYLQQEVNRALGFGEIIGESAAIKSTLKEVEVVAPTGANVLITGESGTGKELIARAIHERSKRHKRPLVKVNCATIPRELFESEFFGHVKGAFTGAVSNRIGRFELADGGTIFLDEIGEVPLELQSKLLRVLQEGEFERVGESKVRKVDVRVISATNQDLDDAMESGTFREDLYYRLSVYPIEVPPLRERPEDIAPLARHAALRVCHELGLQPVSLSDANLEELACYDWPGNVRELQNVIERAVIRSGGKSLSIEIGKKRRSKGTSGKAGVIPMDELKLNERASIAAALKQCNGRIYGPKGAAKVLGIKPTTLASRMNSLGIEKHG